MARKHQRLRHRARALDLFDQIGQPADQRSLVDAEQVLLDVADYVYAHTSLKPISKTLFLISRCLCVAKLAGGAHTATDLSDRYRQVRASLNGTAPGDDFDFTAVVAECEDHVPRVLEAVNRVCRLTDKTDSLGLAFNTLLRGKFEGGEGMGTFLTPEEVVYPMVDMLLKVVQARDLMKGLDSSSLLYGDICGGTGRFVYALARRLEAMGLSRSRLERLGRLFDQSLMAVDLGRLNFLFDGMKPSFERVGDSLIAPQVSELKSRFLFLATNPPFGSGKYRWNKDLTRTLPHEVLAAIGMRGQGDSGDPSELFVFRNLDLLAPGGALAIVLPDGIVQSERFRKTLGIYERVRNTHLDIAAIVSLPPVTFSLGGTVAKTSFVIVQRQQTARDRRLYVAVANHVGFEKRGKKRANDPKGNDLLKIADEFVRSHPVFGRVVNCWRNHESLVTARLMHVLDNGSHSRNETRLAELVVMVREFRRDRADTTERRFHVSILDVDSTGAIDIVSASKNQPMSKGLACKPGDVLVSCMNPRIWRVAVIPDVAGMWSCSAEFVVLRGKSRLDQWRIALGLHHPRVMQSVQAMANGTSSSRQRVPKDKLLSVGIPEIKLPKDLADYAVWRDEFYRRRLLEADAYNVIHEGGSEFSW